MKLFKGKAHIDDRGVLVAFNDFDMTDVVRMYKIQPNVDSIRAWQGNEFERKWFFVVKGQFRIQLRTLESLNPVGDFELKQSDHKVLAIEGGLFNGFQSLEEGSELIVFSDFSLEQSMEDNLRKSLEQVPWESSK